jgi:hypothetical protein
MEEAGDHQRVHPYWNMMGREGREGGREGKERKKRH